MRAARTAARRPRILPSCHAGYRARLSMFDAKCASGQGYAAIRDRGSRVIADRVGSRRIAQDRVGSRGSRGIAWIA
eukprot:gene11648-biopygen8752